MDPKQLEQELRRQVAGFAPGFAELAIVFAFASDALHEVLNDSVANRPTDNLAVPQDADWERYYASQSELACDLPLEDVAEGVTTADLVRSVDDLLTGAGETRRELEDFFTKPEFEGLRSELARWAATLAWERFDATIKEWASGGPGPLSEAEGKAATESQAVAFLIRVFLPCVFRHQATPQRLYRQATDPDNPDLEAAEKLIAIDRTVMHLGPLRALERHPDMAIVARYWQMIGEVAEAPPYRPTIIEVRTKIASFLSYVAGLCNEKLTVPQLVDLFDLASLCLGGSGEVEFSEDAIQPASLTKQINRKRKDWAGSICSVLADKEIQKAVRVFRDRAS